MTSVARPDPVVGPALGVISLFIFGNFGYFVFSNPLTTGSQSELIGGAYAVARYSFAAFVLFQAAITSRGRYLQPTGLVRLTPYVVLASLSLFWSIDFGQSLKFLTSILLFVACIYLLTKRHGALPMMRSVAIYLWCGVALSIVVAVFLPSIGVHNSDDQLQAVHAGLWRGIFPHKNALGGFAAYALVVFVCYSRALNFGNVLRYTGIMSSLLCLAFAGSTTGIVVALVGVASYLLLYRKTPSFRTLTFNVSLIIFLLMAVTSSYEYVLSLFGKASTLTGRSDIWRIAENAFWQRPFLGYGVGMGAESVGDELSRTLGAEVSDSHSGYWDLALELGILGVLSLVGPSLFAIFQAARSGDSSGESEIVAHRAAGSLICMSLFASLTEIAPFKVGGLGVMFLTSLLVLRNGRRRPSFGIARPPSTRTGKPEDVPPLVTRKKV